LIKSEKIQNKERKAVVAEETPQAGGPGPFETRTIRELVGLMSRHDLAELELQDGERSIKLKRNVPVLAAVPMAAPVAAPVYAPAPVAAPAGAAAPAGEAKPAKTLLEIKSPTPGTFYAQDKPGSPPYVQVGAKVSPTTVVCQVEAMKIFNEIPAEVTGTIVEICVENKQPVEYGQVLFRVDPSA
jgi:acetyl-CoA carboxylase biotin carboxyl carrier protein